MKRETLQPSSGTTLTVAMQDLDDDWATALAPDYFSVPIRNRATATIDPDDSNRELLPGEVFIRVFLLVCNKTGFTRTFSARIARGDGTICLLVNEMPIPAKETAIATVQGQFLIQPIARLRGAWELDKIYNKYDVAQVSTDYYACLAPHLADADTEPGAGVDWTSVWSLVSWPWLPDPDRLQVKADTADSLDVSGAGLLTVHATDTVDPNV